MNLTYSMVCAIKKRPERRFEDACNIKETRPELSSRGDDILHLVYNIKEARPKLCSKSDASTFNIANYLLKVKHFPSYLTMTIRPFQFLRLRYSSLILLVAFFSKGMLNLRKSIMRLSACLNPCLKACSSVYLPNFSRLFISHSTFSSINISGVWSSLIRLGFRNITHFLTIPSDINISTTSISVAFGRAPASSSGLICFLPIASILPRTRLAA